MDGWEYVMNKELFDVFDEGEPEIIDHSSEDENDILVNLAKTLTGDQISYILAEWMKLNNKSTFVARAYDESTGSKLLHFRLQAEFGYYLDDLK